MRQSRKILVLGWLFVGVIGCRIPLDQAPKDAPAVNSARDIIQKVRLDDLNSLVVRREDGDRTVVVQIVFAERVVKSFRIGNALVARALVEAVNLDPGNSDPKYLIRIPDRSSTFGAETGIIVYRLQWWEFLLVPDDRFRAEDVDGDGVVELRCERIQNKTYSLVRGVLREKGGR